MNIILIPGKNGLDKGLYVASKIASKGTRTSIRVNLEKVEALVQAHKISHIIIFAGAKYKNKIISPYEAYQILRRLNKRIKILIIDGWKWPVKHQYFYPCEDIIGLIRKCLYQ